MPLFFTCLALMNKSLLNYFGKKEFLFALGRYFVYFLQVLKGFLLAKILGPYVFGIYGIFILAQQYLVYSNFGIQYALNIKLSTEGTNFSNISTSQRSIINSSFSLSIISTLILILISIALIYSNIELGVGVPKPHFILSLLIITSLFHVQEVFLNVARIQKKFYTILITEVLIATGPIIAIQFFNGLELLYAVIILWIMSLFISLMIFKLNLNLSIKWETSRIKPLLIIGLPFLIYNFCFNLIQMSTRSIVATEFDLTAMGLYTFAVSLTSAIMLLFNSAAWIIYPKLISTLSNKKLDVSSQEQALTTLTQKIISFLLTLTLISFLFIPLVLAFLPEYSNSFSSISILLVNQVVINSTFAISSYLVGRKMFRLLIKCSLIALLGCIILMIGFTFLDLGIGWIAFANLIGSLLFFNFIIHMTSKKQNFNRKKIIGAFDILSQSIFVIFSLLILCNYNLIAFSLFSAFMLYRYGHEIFDNFKLINKIIFRS